jgi:hypothetical protein
VKRGADEASAQTALCVVPCLATSKQKHNGPAAEQACQGAATPRESLTLQAACALNHLHTRSGRMAASTLGRRPTHLVVITSWHALGG